MVMYVPTPALGSRMLVDVVLSQEVESTEVVDSGETCGGGVWGRYVVCVLPLLRGDSHDKNVIVWSTTHPVSKSNDGKGYYGHHRICHRSWNNCCRRRRRLAFVIV